MPLPMPQPISSDDESPLPPPPAAAEDGETPSEIHQTHQLPSIGAAIVLRQIPSQGIPFQVWPAATALVALLDRHRLHPNPLLPFPPAPTRILELGSGTGLVAIAAAALFGAKVTATDLPAALPNLQFNVDANAAAVAARGGAVEVAALRWGERRHVEEIMGPGRAYEVVLGSDLVYDPRVYDPLLETLKLLVVEKGAAVIMAHCRRWKKKESVFFRKARKFFHLEVLHNRNQIEIDTGKNRIAVYTFSPK
ncbi:uncharacterized protein LOC127240323 [Andrographis paniculata]|uniref:uncharacterized protein LOC127240323 n=1 Tax=Andrographis paniculata TaxID=175694 RepID=UPI0021E93C71|nr:uncharacterized protein LOC127240323 [Andrographis paniculata]